MTLSQCETNHRSASTQVDAGNKPESIDTDTVLLCNSNTRHTAENISAKQIRHNFSQKGLLFYVSESNILHYITES